MAEKEYIDKEFVMNTINELKAKPLPKTIGLEHLQQIIEDIFADNSDSDDNSETAIVSSIADNILDD